MRKRGIASRVATTLVVALTLFGGRHAAADPFGWFGGSKPAPAPAPAVGTYGQPAPQATSWSSKLTAPLSPTWWTGSRPPAATAPTAGSATTDSLALAFNSGPPTPQLYVSMAELAYRGGNAEQARQHYQQALSMDKKCVDALLGLARLEDREGRLAQATALYQQAAKVAPKNPTVLNDLSLCLARQGKLPDAYRTMVAAINIEPKRELYRNNMAKVCIEMNRLDEALANLNSVHTPAVAQYNMGVLLQQRGRYAESSRYLATALRMEPRMEAARILLARATPSTTKAPLAVASRPAARRSPPAARPAPTPPLSESWAPSTSAPAPSSPAGVDNSILPTPEGSPAAEVAPMQAYPVTSASPDWQLPPQVDAPGTSN